MKKVTQAQLARHLGVTPSTISQAVSSGRIKGHIDKRGRRFLNLEEAEKAFKNNANPVSTAAKAKKEDGRNQNPGRPPVQVFDEEPSLSDHRAKNEKFKALQAELDYEEKKGSLVKAEDVKKNWASIIGIARTKILGISSKARQRIPELTLEQCTVLEAITREALEDLADDN